MLWASQSSRLSVPTNALYARVSCLNFLYLSILLFISLTHQKLVRFFIGASVDWSDLQERFWSYEPPRKRIVPGWVGHCSFWMEWADCQLGKELGKASTSTSHSQKNWNEKMGTKKNLHYNVWRMPAQFVWMIQFVLLACQWLYQAWWLSALSCMEISWVHSHPNGVWQKRKEEEPSTGVQRCSLPRKAETGGGWVCVVWIHVVWFETAFELAQVERKRPLLD